MSRNQNNTKKILDKNNLKVYTMYIHKGVDNMSVKILKWGNSQGVRIPKYILEEINWNADDNFSISVENNKIILKKENNRPTIEELFEGYNGDYKMEEYDWGEPKGDEIW